MFWVGLGCKDVLGMLLMLYIYLIIGLTTHPTDTQQLVPTGVVLDSGVIDFFEVPVVVRWWW